LKRLLVLGLLAAAGSGCGNEAGPKTLAQTRNPGSAARSLTILQLETAPGGALRFNAKVLKATTRRVQLVLHNTSNVPHDIALKGNGVDVKGPVVTGAEKPSTVTATVKPGTYTFYCAVDGHAAAGMRGKLIVAAPA
jgi:uncharacterized cupredoxin-like copper-binding protein